MIAAMQKGVDAGTGCQQGHGVIGSDRSSWLSLLQVDHLNVSFATQTGEVAAVRDVSFNIPESGTLGLVGESGSGKSATSLAIMRLLPPQARIQGNISFAGQDLLALPDNEIRKLRGSRHQHDLSGAHDRPEPGDARGRSGGRSGAWRIIRVSRQEAMATHRGSAARSGHP